MTTYLLDTKIVGHIIKGDLPQVRERLAAVPLHAVTISVVNQGELLYGVAKRGTPARVSRAKAGKALTLPRTAIALTLVVPLVPVGLLEIDRLAGKWTVPKLHISTSMQCDEEDCFAYVHSENVRRLVVDSLISAPVITRYRNAKTLQTEEGHFEARIYLTEPDAKMGPPTIEPGVDKVVRVQKVIVRCPSENVKDRIHMPVALKPGIAYVYVSGSGLGDGWQQIEVEVSRRFVHSLFRGAEGDCKSDLVF